MATFSPTPAPRPSYRRRARPLGANSSASRVINDTASVGSMDVDDNASVFSERPVGHKSETLFAKSDEITVSSYANLPVEVKQILKNADFYSDAYSGGIDTLTGFAVVASQYTCFVWKHAQAVRGTPTCYIFSCPPADEQQGPSFHSLVPYGPNREPGLILISSLGNIRFWHSIGIGLAGGDQFSASSLNLDEDEHVTTLCRSDTQTYFAATSKGQIFRLNLASSGAKHLLTSHVFSRPTSSMSLTRFLPALFSSSSATNHSVLGPGYVNSIALGATTLTGGKEIWALINTRIQKWDVKAEGWEEALFDEDVAEIILPLLRSNLRNVVSEDTHLDLELLDLAIDEHGKLIVLVSYAGAEEDFDPSISINLSTVKRMYALVALSNLSDSLSADSIFTVPYQSTSASGAPMHPRIQVVLGGSIVSVQFGDAVVLCAPASGYYDRLELKSSTDRTLGVGVIESDGSILVLTAAVMMKAYLDIDKVRAFDEETGRADLIKSTMTQAILYGSIPENPLHFSFPPDVDAESLMEGAQQLSKAILESDPSVVRHNHDLGAQMAGRLDRLNWLIQFINDNGALNKLSSRARQRLATDAEKLYACQQLWKQLGDLSGSLPTILLHAVKNYMAEFDGGEHDDFLRDFLRVYVQDIGRLLRCLTEVTLVSAENPNEGPAMALPDTNRIVLTLLGAAFEYREQHLAIYGITLPMIRPWTSKPNIIDIALGLFEASAAMTEPQDSADNNPYTSAVNQQLPELAAVLFACLKERLDWLGSPLAQADPSSANDKKELEQRFALLRPEVLETLRANGHAIQAFALAEQYRDFASLVTLCHKDAVYPPQDNPNAHRISTYMDKFEYEFARELYQWYIQHGELRVMFAETNNVHSAYMDKYFAENPNTSVSWLHDIDKGRYAAAAGALMEESKHATNLSVKHFELSLGKLAHLADRSVVDQTTLDAFHDDLDYISVHEALINEVQSALKTGQNRKHVDAQVEVVTRALASDISGKKGFSTVFRGFVRELLQRKVLSMEDIVEALTLKDNTNSLEDYSTALLLLLREHDLPEARKLSAFKTVWRRVYLHDDWNSIRQTSNVTDVELIRKFKQTALYATLLVILQRPRDVEGYDSTPDDVLTPPTTAEITSRWPGHTLELVGDIEDDYKRECEQLRLLALGDVYHRVRELAKQELGQSL